MIEDLVPLVHGAPTTLTRDAVTILRDRVLTMATIPDPDLVGEIDPSTGGLVVAGAHALSSIRSLRLAHPELPLLAEPSSASGYAATPDRPFQIDEDGLIPETLEGLLQAQRDAGVSLPVTPSGQIAAQDFEALKAVVNGANAVPDPDVVTLVVIADIWLIAPWIDHLCAVLKTSRHPIALGVINGNEDPLARRGAVVGYRRIVQEVQQVIAWRTDLSGIGALAYGAPAAVIGRVPSQRRYSAAGSTPRSSNKTDKTPHVLLPSLMRYSRAQWMQTEWFAQGDPLPCSCRHCGGRAVDRFDESAESIALAHLHNALALRELVAACLDAPVRSAWWIQRLRDSSAEHVTLSSRIGRDVKPLAFVDRWLGEAD